MTTAVSKAKMYVTRKTVPKTKQTTAEETETIILILEVSPLKAIKAKTKSRKEVGIREEEVDRAMSIGEVEEGEGESWEEVEEEDET